MRPAIIRLAKKIIITPQNKNPNLLILWKNINDIIERFPIKCSWKDLDNSYQQKILVDCAELGESVRQVYFKHLPDLNFHFSVKPLLTTSSRIKIVDFTDQPDSLILNFFCITERLTLIDNFGDRLLLVRGVESKSLLEATLIQNTFSVSMNDEYDIVEYEIIK